MSEKFQREQDAIPGLEERELLESMGKDKIVDHIVELGDQATNIEGKMNQAAEVLEGAYGVTVESVLQERELEDTQEMSLSDLQDASLEDTQEMSLEDIRAALEGIYDQP